MLNFFKKAEALYNIAKEVKTCVKAFKDQNFKNNPTKAVDLTVSISKKLEAEYGLKGDAIEYLKSFVKDAIKTFDLVSIDFKEHEYYKAFVDLTEHSKNLITDQKDLVLAIMQDFKDAESDSNQATKEFKTDPTDAGLDLVENVILEVCTTVENTDQTAKTEL